MEQNKSECWQLILQGLSTLDWGQISSKFNTYQQLNFNSPTLNLFSLSETKVNQVRIT